MAQTVVIKVTADTAEAEKSIKRVGQGFEKQTPQVKKFGGAFSGLTKSLALFGVGSIGAGVALQGLTRATNEAAKRQANLQLNIGRLPSQLKTAFDKVVPEFEALGDRFGFTTDEVALAFSELLLGTKQTGLGVTELAGLLGRAATSNRDVTAATNLFIAALNGDTAAVIELTDALVPMEQAHLDYAAAGTAATTVTQKLGADVRDLTADVGEVADSLSKGTATVSDFGAVLSSMKNIVDTISFGAFRQEFAALDETIDNTGRLFLGLKQLFAGGFRLPNFGRGGSTSGFPGVEEEGPGFDFRAPFPRARPRPFAPLVPRASPQRGPGFPGPGSARSQSELFAAYRDFFDQQEFPHGGIVGGTGNRHVPIQAQPGEGVFTEDQMAAMGGRGGGNTTVIFDIAGDLVVDDEFRMQKLTKEIERALTQSARGGNGI